MTIGLERYAEIRNDIASLPSPDSSELLSQSLVLDSLDQVQLWLILSELRPEANPTMEYVANGILTVGDLIAFLQP